MTRIRRASADDAPRLALLRLRFKQEDTGQQEPGEDFLAGCERWLRDRLASGQWLAWVVDWDGQVRGHVFLNRVETVPRPFVPRTELGYVTNFYVQPRYRDQGFGRALLDALHEHARANHIETLIVWPSDRSAALYRRAGYAASAELLELPVVQP
jgi:GNAT superfamily N-acetyltransferase